MQPSLNYGTKGKPIHENGNYHQKQTSSMKLPYNAPPPQNLFPFQSNGYYKGDYSSYGKMYYTPEMMAMAMENAPVKLPRNYHFPMLFASIALYIWIIVAAVINQFPSLVTIVMPVVFYIAIAGIYKQFFIPEFKQFTREQYQNFYEKLKSEKAYFLFRGYQGAGKRMIIKQERYQLQTCENDNFNISIPADETPEHLSVENKLNFYFVDEESAKNYDIAYHSFQEKSPDYRQFTSTLIVENFKDNIFFLNPRLTPDRFNCFYIAACSFGLGILFLGIIEKQTARYKTTMVKRITCR